MRMPQPLFESGYCWASCEAINSNSARAWATVTPGFSRPTTLM